MKRNNRKGKKQYVDARYDKKTGKHSNVKITRDSDIVQEMCQQKIKFSCVARVVESSHKQGHDNVLLQHIIFTYEGIEYYVEHCWLQEYDYPSGFYQTVEEGWKYYMECSFYPYHDAIDRGMHGMKVYYFERY